MTSGSTWCGRVRGHLPPSAGARWRNRRNRSDRYRPV